jgi:hypothetical protein
VELHKGTSINSHRYAVTGSTVTLLRTLTHTLLRPFPHRNQFLCDAEGRPVGRYSPTTNPLSMEADIAKLISQGK